MGNTISALHPTERKGQCNKRYLRCRNIWLTQVQYISQLLKDLNIVYEVNFGWAKAKF